MQTSIESHCFNAVVNTLKDMAHAGVFRGRVGDTLDRVRPAAIVSCYGKSGTEISLPTPGFIVTYLSHDRSSDAGENNSDLGIVRILVQLVDQTTNEDGKNANTYFTWISACRDWILDGALEGAPEGIGHVYDTHVASSLRPDEREWALLSKMKMHFTVDCYTKTLRTKDQISA